MINMGDLGASNNAAITNIPINKDNKDTLFGPSIGVGSNAPEWCAADAALDEKIFNNVKEAKDLNEKDDEKDDDVDELTPEIVKEWVRRSKEVSPILIEFAYFPSRSLLAFSASIS